MLYSNQGGCCQLVCLLKVGVACSEQALSIPTRLILLQDQLSIAGACKAMSIGINRLRRSQLTRAAGLGTKLVELTHLSYAQASGVAEPQQQP